MLICVCICIYIYTCFIETVSLIMTRTTAALFIAGVESLLLTITGVPFLDSFMRGLGGEIHYSGVNRWMLHIQSILLIVTLLLQLIMSTVEKKDKIVSGKEDSEHKIGYKFTLGASNAYCGMLFTMVLYHWVFFLQAVPFTGTLSQNVHLRQSRPPVLMNNGTGFVHTPEPGGSEIVTYASTEQLDFVHALMGSSGWQISQLANTTSGTMTAKASNLPILGSIFFGMVAGYSLLMLLVSMYASYTATPLGEYTPLFLESRVLISANGFIMFGLRTNVINIFGRCDLVEDHVWSVLFFTVVVFFEKYIIMWGVFSPLEFFTGNDKIYESYWGRGAEFIWLGFLAAMPLFFGGIVYNSGDFLLYVSLLLLIVSYMLLYLEYLFVGPQAKQKEDDKTSSDHLDNNNQAAIEVGRIPGLSTSLPSPPPPPSASEMTQVLEATPKAGPGGTRKGVMSSSSLQSLFVLNQNEKYRTHQLDTRDAGNLGYSNSRSKDQRYMY